MPRRSTEFQHLVALIHEGLHCHPAVVTESKLLSDLHTGTPREVDVVIEVETGAYRVVIGVECVERGRRASVGWVQEMVQKHRDLPTDKLVLVAQAGFSKEARRKAEQAGAEAIALEAVTAGDWPDLVAQVQRLHVYYLDAKPLRCRVSYTPAAPPGVVVVQSERQEIHDADGYVWGSLRRMSLALLGKHAHDLMERLELGTPSGFVLVFTPLHDTFVFAADGGRYTITGLKLWGEATLRAKLVALEQRTFKDNFVAWGKPEAPGMKAVVIVGRKGEAGVGILELDESRGSANFDFADISM